VEHIVALHAALSGNNVKRGVRTRVADMQTLTAIKNHVHPEEITKKNIARFKQQIQSLGISFDWSRAMRRFLETTSSAVYGRGWPTCRP